MGWFWGRKNNGDDPAESLDPSLKQFLAEQQPSKYVTTTPQPVVDQPSDSVPEATPQTESLLPIDKRALPRESLFQDGRYKDLWKTYVPQEQMAAVGSTPVERVLQAKKDRRGMIHRAAMENCAFEEELQHQCFKGGNVADRFRARVTMCRDETRAFNRCYQLQAKFLQALGYATSLSSTTDDEERIQMHADTLYHRMMDYEAAVDYAKTNNQPIPPLSSLFDPTRPAPTLEEMDLPKSVEKNLKRPLNELPAHERELAARAAEREARVAGAHADDIFKYTISLNEERKQRQAWLIKAFGEPVGKFLIPDMPTEPATKTPEA